jgi:small-conductance mechanosensitive channel
MRVLPDSRPCAVGSGSDGSAKRAGDRRDQTRHRRQEMAPPMSEPGVLQILDRWFSDPLTGRLIFLLVGLALVVLAARLLHGALLRYVRDSATRYRARKIVTGLSYLAAAVVAILAFGGQIQGLTVALGVAGAGIAFALQEVITSVAGWIAISSGGFYAVGDRVQLGGIKGDVIDIGILRTTVMEIGAWVNSDQYNGRVVRVANSFVFKEPVFNYSGEFPFLWDEIMVPIKYGSDYHLAREILERVALEIVGDYADSAERAWEPFTRRYMIEAASVRPVATMVANQNWIEFTLRYAVGYSERRSTKDRLFTRILEEIDRTGGKVGIAAATLNVEKLAPLEVRLSPGP